MGVGKGEGVQGTGRALYMTLPKHNALNLYIPTANTAHVMLGQSTDQSLLAA